MLIILVVDVFNEHGRSTTYYNTISKYTKCMCQQLYDIYGVAQNRKPTVEIENFNIKNFLWSGECIRTRYFKNNQ